MNDHRGPAYSLSDKLWIAIRTHWRCKLSALVIIAVVSSIANQSVITGLRSAGWAAIFAVPLVYAIRHLIVSEQKRSARQSRY